MSLIGRPLRTIVDPVEVDVHPAAHAIVPYEHAIVDEHQPGHAVEALLVGLAVLEVETLGIAQAQLVRHQGAIRVQFAQVGRAVGPGAPFRFGLDMQGVSSVRGRHGDDHVPVLGVPFPQPVFREEGRDGGEGELIFTRPPEPSSVGDADPARGVRAREPDLPLVERDPVLAGRDARVETGVVRGYECGHLVRGQLHPLERPLALGELVPETVADAPGSLPGLDGTAGSDIAAKDEGEADHERPRLHGSQAPRRSNRAWKKRRYFGS